MALDPLNGSNLEQLALKGLSSSTMQNIRYSRLLDDRSKHEIPIIINGIHQCHARITALQVTV